MTSLHSSLSIGQYAERLGHRDCHVFTPTFVALASSRRALGIDRAAARLGVDTLACLAPTSTTVDLVQAFRVVNQSIVSTAGPDHEQVTASVALVALALHRDAGLRCVAIASVGDSGVYRRRGGALWRVSGRSADRPSPALGVADLVDVEVWELDVEPGDLFVLCSEAVSAAIDDDTVAGICDREASGEAVADAIELAAVDAGAGGDVGVIVVLVG